MKKKRHRVEAIMEMADAKRVKALEEENRRLKALVADQALNIAVLKEVNSKVILPGSAAGGLRAQTGRPHQGTVA
jgi:uncharacterized protein YllA (UPF0747 family)